MESLLRLDARVPMAPDAEAARDAFSSYSKQLGRCGDPATDAEQWVTCALDVLLGEDGIRPTSRPALPEVHAASFAVASREGSCSAIVAAVLAVCEPYGAPFEAIVLRDHVVLALRGSDDHVFEPLEGGRRLSQSDLAKHGPAPPGSPIRTDGHGFLPYYLDNLAVRLAEAGDAGRAEVEFREALSMGPRVGRVRFDFGTFLLQAARYEESVRSLEKAIRLGWDDAAAWVNRGVALWKLGKTRAARRSFEHALALQPDNREAAINLKALSERAQPTGPR
ncbi:MAG: tetratricopeptide repeat protein [Acidobacteriia bacterium]|nr:tetratricopeptide repeat protein [Terriglobia bacterium]